jgi:hypothetical protein
MGTLNIGQCAAHDLRILPAATRQRTRKMQVLTHVNGRQRRGRDELRGGDETSMWGYGAPDRIITLYSRMFGAILDSPEIPRLCQSECSHMFSFIRGKPRFCVVTDEGTGWASSMPLV